MGIVDSTLRGRLATLAVSLESRAPQITADVEEAISAAVPEFADHESLGDMREASIGRNVDEMLEMLRLGVDAIEVSAPAAALSYARRLAVEGLPPALLVRCYRVGQSRFLRHCLEALTEPGTGGQPDTGLVDGELSIVLIDHVSDYVDRVLEQVLGAYEDARGYPTRPAAPGDGVALCLDFAAAEPELG